MRYETICWTELGASLHWYFELKEDLVKTQHLVPVFSLYLIEDVASACLSVCNVCLDERGADFIL